ncbi:hypothetical protein B296_00006915 [Ensete ventricosum]|uniref:Uncharacterized protein n=1 Tax=Ensete ventricosum TaxID=4639 RepID=A0A426ZVK6_ENSVE|nr:hypothetical protein B296_00006915 [Ensete ventricosum]
MREIHAKVLVFLLSHPKEGHGDWFRLGASEEGHDDWFRLGASEEVHLELSREMIKRVDSCERQPIVPPLSDPICGCILMESMESEESVSESGSHLRTKGGEVAVPGLTRRSVESREGCLPRGCRQLGMTWSSGKIRGVYWARRCSDRLGVPSSFRGRVPVRKDLRWGEGLLTRSLRWLS